MLRELSTCGSQASMPWFPNSKAGRGINLMELATFVFYHMGVSLSQTNLAISTSLDWVGGLLLPLSSTVITINSLEAQRNGISGEACTVVVILTSLPVMFVSTS